MVEDLGLEKFMLFIKIYFTVKRNNRIFFALLHFIKGLKYPEIKDVLNDVFSVCVQNGSDCSVQSVIRSRCQTRAQSHVEGAEDETR